MAANPYAQSIGPAMAQWLLKMGLTKAGASSSAQGWAGAGLNAAIGAGMAKDTGEAMQEGFSDRFGDEGPKTMAGKSYTTPTAPHILSKRAQQEHAVGSAALSTIPVIGTIAGIAGNVLHSDRASGAATDYMAKLFNANPDVADMNLEAPIVEPGSGERATSALGGHDVASGALSGAGAGAGIGTMAAPGVGTAVGAIVGAIAGGILGGASKKSAKKREKEAMVIAQRNKEKLLSRGGEQAARGTALQAQIAGLPQGTDQVSRYILQALQGRARSG